MRALPTLASVIILCSLAAVVISQRLSITQVGYKIGDAESEQRRLQEQRRQLAHELSAIESRESIENLIRQHGITLVPPEDAPKDEGESVSR